MRGRGIAVLVAIALASACSGGSDKPRALPSLSATATPSATTVVVPSAAKAHTPFGAAAFVRFYYAQVNEAYRTASADALTGLVDPQCGTCKEYANAVSGLATKSQRIQGDAVEVVSAESPPEANGYVAVDTFLKAPARAIVDSSGRVIERLNAGPARHKTVYVMFVGGVWHVRAIRDAA